MDLREVKAVMIAVNKELCVYGRCQILSVASGDVDVCTCAKCQIDDMNPVEIMDKAQTIVQKTKDK